ncbi:hypothetical protein D1007_24932 [Hordeum vulgare]|nr:hypothetical protein D1007_24932 [Hordeum vulgare]
MTGEGPIECYHRKIAKKFVACEGSITGRRFYGCGEEIGNCGFIEWVDMEYREAAKKALEKLWAKYEGCRAARTMEGVDHAKVVLKLQDYLKIVDLQYKNLVVDVKKIMQQQV